MTAHMNVVFVHGWGFHPCVWAPVVERLSGIDAHYVDLGFVSGFEGEVVQALPEDAVLVGHSLGVMWLLKNLPARVRGFVSVSGFDCFYKHVHPRTVKLMQRRLSGEPYDQMQDFWASCGVEDFCGLEAFNVERLDEGLDWLMNWDAAAELQALSCPVMALGARNDQIVTPEMSRAIWQDYDLRISETGGHMLPLTQAEWCAQHIQGFINDLHA